MLECYRFNAQTYEPAREYLTAAFEHIITAGGDVRQLTQFAFERFGGMFVPYLCQFLCDVHEGRIRIDGLTESGSLTIVGQPMSAGQREGMIRESAYFRAERRGFSGCSPLDDWLCAEREVDARLAEESILVGERQSLAAAVSGSGQELGLMQDIITDWLEKNHDVSAGAQTGLPPVRRPPAGKEPAAGAAARPAQPAQRMQKGAVSRKKVQAATGPGADGGSAPARKTIAGKKPVSGRSASAGRPAPAASRKQAAGKEKPLAGRKGRMAAGRKKAVTR